MGGQACYSRKRKKVWKVPSESREGLFFEVKYIPRGSKPPSWTCDCEHYRYRGSILGTCKHIEKKQEEVCRWKSTIGPEQQDKKQMQAKVCPKCGGDTYDLVSIGLKRKPKWTWTAEKKG